MSSLIPDGPPGLFGRFFLPGPTEVRPEILEAQAREMIGHRGPAIVELMKDLEHGLQQVFLTERPVFISSSSATGLMEAAVRNGASGRVLSLVNGAFSQRFAEIAQACGLEVDVFKVPLGQTHDPSEVEERLRAHRYDAVTVVHSETSTGALNPISDIARVVTGHEDTFMLVDSVTGVGGAEMRTDAWKLDFVLTGSQKALALPPGLAFGVASERMMARSATLKNKGVYFDLTGFAESLAKFNTPNTPAISLMYSLHAQLEKIEKETIEARWARHTDMARCTWEWVDRMREEKGAAFGVLAPEGFRSPTVTAITLPDGMRGPPIVKALAERGWVIGDGYGKLKDSTIRIGHMGDHVVTEVEELLGVLEEVIQ